MPHTIIRNIVTVLQLKGEGVNILPFAAMRGFFVLYLGWGADAARSRASISEGAGEVLRRGVAVVFLRRGRGLRSRAVVENRGPLPIVAAGEGGRAIDISALC